MIYERWFTVKDCNGLDYLYYSEIRKKPFDNAVKHQNKSFKGILEKRMNGLLKKNVSVDLNYQNLITGLPVSFTIYYRNMPIVEYGGNYMDLNILRNEIYMIDQYDIRNVFTRINENGEVIKLVHIRDEEYCIPVQRNICLEKSSGRRNYKLIDDDLMDIIFGHQYLQNGERANERETFSLC